LFDDDEQLAVASLFEAQGRKRANESGLELLVRHKLGKSLESISVVIPTTATGDAISSGVVDGDQIFVDGIVFGNLQPQSMVAVASADGAMVVYQLPSQADGLLSCEVKGLDGQLKLTRLSGNVNVNQCQESDVDWRAAETSARRAIAHELIALAEMMLAKASDYVRERKQFGRALGSLQVVRNALSDVHVAIEGSRDMLRVAFEEDDSLSAMIAKAQAGNAAQLAARHSQQFCGAMGWTWEFGLHQFVRRTKFIDSIFGSSDSLTRMIGSEIATAGCVPVFSFITKDNV